MEKSEIIKLIKEVLDKGYLMSLAITDDGGVWVSDVIYIHDEDLKLYWMSSPHVRHSKAVMQNPHVAGTITVSVQGEDNMGIQFSGVAEKIKESRRDLAIKHFEKRKKPIPNENEDVLDGDLWYIIQPKKIDLIYEKLFGFKKQKIEM